jgi:hypothetical protein
VRKPAWIKAGIHFQKMGYKTPRGVENPEKIAGIQQMVVRS